MLKSLRFVLFCFVIFFYSCTEEENTTTVIVTEEILYSSSENLRLLGRIITNELIELNDHGFYISEEETFSAPIIISLGSKKGPGRFIGETDGLTNSKSYYAKAFMDVGGEIQYGNVIQLKTLAPSIKSFSPYFGAEGDDFIIKGTNFTKDTQVFFGDTQVPITSIVDESTIHLKIPPPKTVNVPIKLICQNVELEFSTLFEYKTGTYEIISVYPDPFRLADAIFYLKDGNLVLGLGNMSIFALYPRMKRFDLKSQEWFDIQYSGSNRSYGFSTENYLGGGTSNLDTLGYKINYTFFKIIGNDFEKLEDLKFISRESIAFEIKEELYVIGSLEEDFFGVRKYNPTNKTWTRITQAPAILTKSNPFFVYQNKFYVVDSDKFLWEFDPNTLFWRKVSVFPGNLGLGYGMGQVIGDKAYIGLYKRTSEFWELDMSNFSWKIKKDIPGSITEVTVAHYSYGGSIYLIRTPDRIIAGNYPMNLYKFDPDGF
ncbi:IPT/TIG domain-containing protein [Algoriphagus pacificus]|uniref:IPT/TIG domain-containing protein n=1 Tax=Algoriphagus pacificus TaxID=2811234 RepID=A0ABS3CCS3_9BACT|nr:IPT/TIG domain-containing protein [Algoriphagus pacificus]MBN7814882.1 IPT/TIG domain-containing protein [Algoriphagus pacificus]